MQLSTTYTTSITSLVAGIKLPAAIAAASPRVLVFKSNSVSVYSNSRDNEISI